MNEKRKKAVLETIAPLLDELPDDFMMLYVQLSTDRYRGGGDDLYQKHTKYGLIVPMEGDEVMLDDTDTVLIQDYDQNGLSP